MNLIQLMELNNRNRGRGLIEYFMSIGVFAQNRSIICPRCNWPTVLETKPDNQFRWRCNKRVNKKHCTFSVSIRKNTFFEGSHLSIFKIAGFVNLWLQNASNAMIMHELNIGSSRTVVDWCNFCREVLYDHIIVKKQPIGGIGTIVEIDESKFGKRKYHRGHFVEGQWIFGGIERESKRCFMVPVARRDKKTLQKIIAEWILPGTIIYSDCWAAYNDLNKLGYTHKTVNHSQNFVDPITGVHTNTIESLWNASKRSFSSSGRRKWFYAGYLSKYSFLHQCRVSKVDPFEEFFKAAAILYDPHADTNLGVADIFKQAEYLRNKAFELHGLDESDNTSDESDSTSDESASELENDSGLEFDFII